MSIEGQGHFFTIYFPGFVCFVLYLAKISGERLQDHWSSGLVRRYGCSTSHTIVPFTIGCKFRTFSVTHSLAYKNKETFKIVNDI